MKPAVSIPIAARDYGRYLGDALRSVQLQTFTDWELVLVDDGSRDDTVQVVRPFLGDSRFRYVRSDTLGQTRSKNLAIRLSQAPLLAPLDGDDVWLPTKLERQVRLWRAEPELGAIFCRRFLIDDDGAIMPSEHLPFKRGMIFDEVLLHNFVCYSSTLVTREALERVGGFDNRLELAIDYDLWLRVSKHYRFDFIDEPLVKYRTGHSNLSKRIKDRITLVLSLIRRTLMRRGNVAALSDSLRREAFGSTCRTMGFVHRDSETWQAARWYWRAATYDRKWRATFRAIARSAWKNWR
jgi:glycosyltransferase involved in cell wall biosynthesis